MLTFSLGLKGLKKMLLAALNEPCVLAEKTLICCSWHRFCPLVAVHERCVVIACNVLNKRERCKRRRMCNLLFH